MGNDALLALLRRNHIELSPPPAVSVPVAARASAPAAVPIATPTPIVANLAAGATSVPVLTISPRPDELPPLQWRPELPVAYSESYQAGRARMAAGDYAAAVLAFKAALAIKYVDFEAHYALASAYSMLGDDNNARRELDLARTFLR